MTVKPKTAANIHQKFIFIHNGDHGECIRWDKGKFFVCGLEIEKEVVGGKVVRVEKKFLDRVLVRSDHLDIF